jgi:hypothetical protein
MSHATLIITHIPKTAGTTLRQHLLHDLNPNDELIHLANAGKTHCAKTGQRYFTERSLEHKKLARVIIGHDVNFDTKCLLEDHPFKEVVTFRDPQKWEISRYNQHVNRLVKRGQRALSFAEWLKDVNKFHSQYDWFLAHYLCLKGQVNKLSETVKISLLEHALSQFEGIYLLDQFPQLLEDVLSHLGLEESSRPLENQNVVGVHKDNYFTATDEHLALLEQQCRFDQRCHALVQEHLTHPVESC